MVCYGVKPCASPCTTADIFIPSFDIALSALFIYLHKY